MLKPLGKIANSLTYFLLLSFFILSASPSFAQLIPKTNWTLASVDSQEVLAEPTGAVKAFDGNASTFWHTRWSDINPDPPPPHEIQINLGAVYNVSGFRYLPRQDGDQNGRIKQYEFYVSLDGGNWGTPVASGIFLNDDLEKVVTFTPKAGHYVRLQALSEVNGNPWTSMAELNVLGTLQIAPGDLIPKSNWLASVDSQEVLAEPTGAVKAFDGNTSTFWHTRWSDINPDPPPPHEIQINLGAVYNVSGFRYLPRQDGAQNGWVGQFEFYVSSDGSNWGTAVFTGTFGKNASEKEVLFTAKTGQYVLFRSLSEVNGNPWTSAAELSVLGSLSSAPAGTLQFSAATYSVAENIAGGTATITVTRTGGSAGAVGVSFATSNGTASAGSDYTAVSQTVSFAAGDTANKTVSVPITNDTSFEPDETVNLTLSAPTGGATLSSPSTAVLTITDNDPALAITSINPTSGPVGTSVTISGSNFGSTKGASTVTFNGTAATPSNWTATSITAPVPAGATTGSVVVTVGGLASNGVTFTVTIPKTNWTLKFVDSQETVAENGAATNSFDGNNATIWHTRYSGVNPVPPPPHEIQINLGDVYNVSGFRYLPRQEGVNGRIAQYEFYVSSVVNADGTVNWGTAVATGTFANDALEKQVLFTLKTGRYVRLRALSEVNGGPWTTMAELNVLQAGTGSNQAPDGVINTPAGNATIVVGSAINFTGTGTDPDGNTPLTYRWSFGTGSGIPDSTVEDPGVVQFNTPGAFTVTFTVADSLGLVDPTPATRTITVQSGSSGVVISQNGWTLVSVDSEEVVGEDGRATNAFDGNNATIWHTQYFNINPDPPPPHEIKINLGATYDIGGFRYLPRQDGVNGRIGQYEFYVSLNGVNWGSPVAAGTFANNALVKEVSFIPRPGQYVRLRALSEVNGNPWTSMAELNVLQAACITPSVSLVQLQSYYLQTLPDLDVVAEACVTGGQGVRLMIDGGSASGGAQFDDFAVPYEVIFTGVAQSEHVIDAFVIDAAGNPVSGIATYDQAIQVGIGDYYVAMGDSITHGDGDDVHSDDSSQDGRNIGGGYTPILDDLLTADKGIPHTVVNEGVGGSKSAGGRSLIPTLLQKHPDAQRFLIMYGTNDAGGIPVPSGRGLHPGDSGYPGTFKDNMQQIINAIKSAGKVAILAKAPVALPVNGQRDTLVQEYSLVIDELVQANIIPFTPPDFHAYFAAGNPAHYTTEYSDSLHPNGIGYQSMANLWIQVLTQ